MKSTEDYVRSLGYNAHIVRGDLDTSAGATTEPLPDSKVVRIGELQVGLIHGHQIVPWGDTEMLANHARAMGVDVLVHGHSHQAAVARVDGSATSKEAPMATTAAAAAAASSASATAAPATAAAASASASGPSTLLLNPGSLTGAFSPFTTAVSPSFLLLAVQGPTVIIYTYELNAATGEVGVTKSEWKKQK
jgi:vacuolar protein sorting-associated protein 29